MQIKNKIVKNASWIIGCKIVQSVLNIVISMIVARTLGPSNFGLLNYATSVVAFFIPLMNLGINNILVNEFVNSPENEHTIMGSALTLTSLSAILCMGGVGLFVGFVNAGERDTLIVALLYSLVLLAQAFELTQYWFQYKYLSKFTAIVMLAAYVVVTGYKIVILILKTNVYWFSVVNAIDYFLIAIALFFLFRKHSGGWPKFSKSVALRLLKNGRPYIISTMMITVYAQTGSVLLKLLIDETAVGFYTTATTITGMTGFVFTAIIDSMRPAIFEAKKESREKYETYVKKLYCIITYMSLAQSIAFTLLAKPIVSILYGSAYQPAVPILQVVVWYLAFSYMGGVRNIWILAEQKTKYLWIINLSGALLNVTLNLVLIPYMGIMGAAVATVITQIFTNVIIGYIIKPIRGNNRLLIQGLDPRVLLRKKK